MEPWIFYVITPLILAYLAYNERDKSMIKKDVEEHLTGPETEHLIDLKNEPMNIMQRESAKDIKQLDTKLDKIEDLVRKLYEKNVN